MQILVIKCGGSIINNGAELAALLEDIVTLKTQGYTIVIVHGGGPDINQLCTQLHLKSAFIDGLRVTSKEILDATQMTLIGKTNANLTYKFNQANIHALGLSGHDMNLLLADFIDQPKFGFVGEITQVNSAFITSMLQMQIVPVIAPLAIDNVGNTFNVNADLAAAAIASALQATQLILLSDIDGYYANYPDPASLVSHLKSVQIKELLATPDKVSSGMIPKLTACYQVVEDGVQTAHIINGNTLHGLAQVIHNPNSLGTTVTK